MEHTPTPRKVIRITRLQLIIGVIILAIVAFLIINGLGRSRMMNYGVTSGGYGGGVGMMAPEYDSSGPSSNSMPSIQFEKDYYPYPYPNPTPDITDTREFLKVSYSAQIQTRDVDGVVRDVKGIVRDFDGRIDNFSSSEKYGSVSFVVPKSNFDAFRDEIESLTHKKLYTENVSSENLLGQKQNIEEQGEAITSTLAQLEKRKRDADATHAAKVSVLSAELTAVQVMLRTSDKPELLQREATLKYNLDQENKTYAAANSSLIAQINQQKKNLEGNVKQNIQFGNNIETVSGSINVNWISCWDMMKLFSPIHPTIIIIILVIILWYFLNRKNYLPKIEII